MIEKIEGRGHTLLEEERICEVDDMSRFGLAPTLAKTDKHRYIRQLKNVDYNTYIMERDRSTRGGAETIRGGGEARCGTGVGFLGRRLILVFDCEGNNRMIFTINTKTYK